MVPPAQRSECLCVQNTHDFFRAWREEAEIRKKYLQLERSMMTSIKRLTLLAIHLALHQFSLVIGFSSVSNTLLSSHRNHLRNLASLLVASQGTVPTIEIANNEDEVNELASRLLKTCAEYGQIGSKLSDEQRANIDDLASLLGPYSDRAPAQCDLRLRGRHTLIYSASPGASSGALGPLVGAVSQSFVDEVRLFLRGCCVTHFNNFSSWIR